MRHSHVRTTALARNITHPVLFEFGEAFDPQNSFLIACRKHSFLKSWLDNQFDPHLCPKVLRNPKAQHKEPWQICHCLLFVIWRKDIGLKAAQWKQIGTFWHILSFFIHFPQRHPINANKQQLRMGICAFFRFLFRLLSTGGSTAAYQHMRGYTMLHHFGSPSTTLYWSRGILMG